MSQLLTLFRPRRLGALLGVLLAPLAWQAADPSSSMAAPPPIEVTTVAPDVIRAGHLMRIATNVENTGSVSLQGELTITYYFPEGIEPSAPNLDSSNLENFGCTFSAQTVQCTGDATGIKPGVIIRYNNRTLRVAASATGELTGSVEISGPAIPLPISEQFHLAVGESSPFGIRDLAVRFRNAPTSAGNQAGADPEQLDTTVHLISEARSIFELPAGNTTVTAPTENFRDVVTHVPPGMLANPTALPARCTAAQLTTRIENSTIPQCPLSSQIGVVSTGENGDLVPLWEMVPPRGYPAAFGFFFESVVVVLLAKVRSQDNGIDLVVESVSSSIPLPQVRVTLWGDPADPSHDPLRGECLQGGFGFNATRSCEFKGQPTAFLRNPTSCPRVPLPWSIEMDTYQHPGTFVSSSTTTPATEGCERVPFIPSLSLASSEHSAHSPSGLDLALTMPQERSPGGLAQADLRSVELQLPQGVAINSASADGLAACTAQQLRLGLEGPSQCPDAAKIGSLELTTPLLEEPISGSVYLRSQASEDPESGELFRVALEIRSDERGVDIKLPGQLRVNPTTGQLMTSFRELPQLPLESMELHLKTGPRAPLTTPQTCGTYVAHATLEGWNGKVETIDPTLTVDQGCTPPPFAPGFEAGVTNATAGRFAPFSLRVTRDSGQPNVSRIDASLPEGELAKLAGVGVCDDGQAASGTCPASSRIGQVTAGIGEGAAPLFLPQQGKTPTALYLAGPYNGGPYSVVAEVPAQAGPFDLGQVVVRSALRIDPDSTRVTVASDPLPQIVQGVPVSYRDIRVEVDRPQFTVNPTDCEPMATAGTIASRGGATVNVSDRFQVGDCASLGFRPKLSIALKGKTGRSGHPALTAFLWMPTKGANANIARASVSLPHSEFLAQGHIKTICTRVQYSAGNGGGARCPKGSVYGRATAWSPLLDRPLSGPVYLRSSNNPLPDLVASLDGQIHVDLDGRIDSDPKTGGLRTTFDQVPDAPVAKFVLKMPGGKKSLLENSTDICRGKHRAIVRMKGQNGRVRAFKPLVRAKCGK
jgi:hypothetical protein